MRVGRISAGASGHVLDELDAHIMDETPRVAPLLPVVPPTVAKAPARRLTPPPVRPSSFGADPKPVAPSVPARAPAKVAPAQAPKGFPVGVGMMWVGVAMTIGIGLRFLDLPDYMIPVVVGLAVAAVVVLGMVYLIPQQDEEPEQVSAPAPSPRPASKSANRLSGYTRRAAAKSGRGVNDN